jgi:hypothetical protein
MWIVTDRNILTLKLMMKVIEPESKAINYTHISTTVTATDLS